MSPLTPPNLPPLATLRPWVDRFRDARITVWGDVVADRFVYGATTRVSREAPALVLRREGEEIRPGGAGNTMMNAAALGARVAAVGYLGGDSAGDDLRQVLDGAGVVTDHLVVRTDAPTPKKTRVMAGGVHTVRQQVLRIDEDDPWPDLDAAATDLDAALNSSLDDTDALLVSDYSMGSVREAAVTPRIGSLHGGEVPVVADSRAALLSFARVTAATPNEEEVEKALGVDLDGDTEALERAGRQLLEQLAAKAILITRGSSGMALFEEDAPTIHLPIHGTNEIADVTGAGDAVIAAFTLALVAGASMLEAALISNVAGALVVRKRGTATISADELGTALEIAT